MAVMILLLLAVVGATIASVFKTNVSSTGKVTASSRFASNSNPVNVPSAGSVVDGATT